MAPTPKQIRAWAKKNECGAHKTAEHFKISRAKASRILAGVNPKGFKGNRKQKVTKKRTLDDFRGQYDKDFIIPKKIEEAIEALGKDGWLYEAEFSRESGVSLSQLAIYRENYTDYTLMTGKHGRRVWAGSKEFASQLRNML